MNNEYIENRDYVVSSMQLWELFENIERGDYDYARSMLELFKHQKLERLRDNAKADEETKRRQLEQEQIQEFKSE